MFAAIRLPAARRFTALILRETINGSVNFMTNFPPMARVPGNCNPSPRLSEGNPNPPYASQRFTCRKSYTDPTFAFGEGPLLREKTPLRASRLNGARMPSMADEVATLRTTARSRTAGSRKYRLVEESFELMFALYQPRIRP